MLGHLAEGSQTIGASINQGDNVLVVSSGSHIHLCVTLSKWFRWFSFHFCICIFNELSSKDASIWNLYIHLSLRQGVLPPVPALPLPLASLSCFSSPFRVHHSLITNVLILFTDVFLISRTVLRTGVHLSFYEQICFLGDGTKDNPVNCWGIFPPNKCLAPMVIRLQKLYILE